jgi:hypothetical protein
MLVCVAVACAITQFAFISRGWFYLDDFRNLGQAKRWGLTPHLLVTPIGGEHFQPGGRLLHWLVAVPVGTHFKLGAAILAACIAMTAYLTARLADDLFGQRVLHVVIAALVGTSWIFMSTSMWFAGADTVPATMFMVAACLLYCRWYTGGGRWRYACAVGCTAAAVLFWEQALIIPVLIAGLWVCFLRSRNLRPDRLVWQSLVPFVGVTAAFVVYVDLQPWHQSLQRPAITQVARLVQEMLLRGMLPPVAGSWMGTDPLRASDGAVVVGAGLVAGLVALAARRRLRPSALLFFTVSFLALAATVAATRIAIGPMEAATTTRYLGPLPVLFGLAVAGAVRPRAGRDPAGNSTRRRPSSALRWPVALLVAACLGVLYLHNLTGTADTRSFSKDNGRHALQISARIGQALRPGMTNLVDTRLTWPVFYPSHDGADLVSTLAPFWAPRVQAIGEGTDLIGFAHDGSAHRVTFHPGSLGPNLYVRIAVNARQPGNMRVMIRGAGPVEPERAYQLAVPAGSDSFMLPTWSSNVMSIDIQHGPALTVTSTQLGIISLSVAGT